MDEFCAGVQIILKRVESHPEDFTQEYGPWKRLMASVLSSKRGGDYDDKEYLKPLTDAEIDALHKAFLPLARQQFDSWVMREILAEPKEEGFPQAPVLGQGQSTKTMYGQLVNKAISKITL